MRDARVFAIVCATTAAAASCTADLSTSDLPTSESSQAIIGGTPVGDAELPTLGAITTNVGSICTGTLISPTAVLTAAHCVEPNLLKQAAQQAGETPPDTIEYRFSFARDLHIADDADFLAVASVDWHGEFLMDSGGLFERPGKWNDIAIVHLAAPVTDRPAQQLAPTDVVAALEMGRTQLVAGYGLTDDANPMSAGILTQGTSQLDERGDFEIIAGDADPQQACRGDSGGPIFADDGETYQIGIASRINLDLFPPPTSPPPCETGLLYTRVDSYLAWIQERVPDLGEGVDPEDPEDPEDPDDEEGGGCCSTSGGGGAGAGALGLAVGLLILRRRRPAASRA